MTILLAGDIGGTKTILRLVQAEKNNKILILTTLAEKTYPSQEFIDLVPMICRFFQETQGNSRNFERIEKACFGIAGPVVDNTSELTNLNWSLSSDRLEKELTIPYIKLINDFAAIGYGISQLNPEDLHTLQDLKPNLQAPVAVIGAGTGLGEGFLIPLPNGNYQVFGSEGSHADFPARSLLEFQLVNFIKEKHQIDRVSIERVVSGQGIVDIYQFLREQNPSQESPRMAKIYQMWLQEQDKTEKSIDLAAEISQTALNRIDCLCDQTLQLFIEAYGVEAGNLALKLLPYGGLYIAGGIAAKILPLLTEGSFIKAFQAKGRMSILLQDIPLYIILNPKVGLMGAAVCASQL